MESSDTGLNQDESSPPAPKRRRRSKRRSRRSIKSIPMMADSLNSDSESGSSMSDSKCTHLSQEENIKSSMCEIIVLCGFQTTVQLLIALVYFALQAQGITV